MSNGNTAFLVVVNGVTKPANDAQAEGGKGTFVRQGETITGASKLARAASRL